MKTLYNKEILTNLFGAFDPETVYTDIPINHSISRPVQPETPQRIREMRSIAFTAEAQWKTSAWLFYTQGTMTADYEDDFPYDTSFVRYYPTYRDLTVPQLRGYFAWRTKLRHSEPPLLITPYLLLYTYELINCIGFTNPEDACRKLIGLSSLYPDAGQSYLSSLSEWITDFVVNYELPADIIADTPDMVFDRSLLTLTEYDKHSDDEIYCAIKTLSAYPVDESLFVMQYQEDFKEAAVASFRFLSDYFKDHRKNTLCDKYFGKPIRKQHQLFASAIFYNKHPLRNCDIMLDPIHRYTCTNGSWFCEKYYGNRRKNKSLGVFIRTLDSIMRERYGFRYKLADSGTTKNEINAINSALDWIEAVKLRKRAARVDIDLSLLGDIRRAADKTRDSLLVDEESTDIPDTPQTNEAVQQENDKALLTAAERVFLQALVDGSDHTEAARNAGSLPSLLADAINEKLFDEFGDTVIDFTGDEPVLIEDYTDDIRELLKRGR